MKKGGRKFLLSETVSNKSLTFTFKATEITFDVVIAMLDKLLKEKTREKTGKQSIKDLRKKGNLQVIDVKDETLKKLQNYLKKFNIDYSILKSKTEEKQYSLFFRNYDAELLNKVLENFLHNKFKNKESIKEKIKRIKQMNIDKRTEEKDKTKKKRKEVEL
mgnify:FL=1